MSCNFCENFDPNDKKEGWYGRPSGGQYELNQYVGGGQGPHAGPKTSGTSLNYETTETDTINDYNEPDYTPVTEGFKNLFQKQKQSSGYNLIIIILFIIAVLSVIKCVQKCKK
jgi:hypothetical protein